jgi:adenosylcobinamide-GDP ribazoletransferase
VDHNEEILNKSRKYFPLMGWIVGGVTGLTYYIFALIFPVSISILISMIVGVLLTGAFHEDGFTDVCDSFGGGWGKENILKIMKEFGKELDIVTPILKVSIIYIPSKQQSQKV